NLAFAASSFSSPRLTGTTSDLQPTTSKRLWLASGEASLLSSSAYLASFLGDFLMSKHMTNDHELSRRHFRQIICRPMALRNKLLSIWGITWRPGDRRNSFHGSHFRPLGSALMMVQVSYPREQNREGIGLFGIAARIEPQTA